MVRLRRGSVLDVDADRLRLGLRLRSAQRSWENPQLRSAWDRRISLKRRKLAPHRGCYCRPRTQATMASTTAFGCSGSKAWLALRITATVTRLPSSSLSSFMRSIG